MTNRNGAHDEDCDMLVIGSGLGGSVVALQLTKKRYRTRLLAVGRRSPDKHATEAAWDIKRFAWAPLGLKGCNGDIKVDGRQPLLTQPIGVLVAAYSRQHGEAEFAQMQRSRLPDTGGSVVIPGTWPSSMSA